MKKGILLTSVSLLFTILVTGCSCSKDGTYNFSHIEYAENGENVTSDCSSPLGEHEIEFCTIVKNEAYNKLSFVLEDKKITIAKDGSAQIDNADYKIKGGKILIKEDGEEEYVNIYAGTQKDLRYEDKSVKLHTDFYTIVFKK